MIPVRRAYYMFRSLLRKGQLSRDRALRRVMSLDSSFDQIDSKLKLSKIPTDFVHFDNIRGLPDRQLAYTAHLAHRLGMENEDLWEQIRDAFLDSHSRMRPKLVTQCLVAIAKRPWLLDEKSANRVAVQVSQRASEFRFADLVMVLNGLASLNIRSEAPYGVVPVLSNHLTDPHLAIDERTIAMIFSSLGKLKIFDRPVFERLLELADQHCDRFNEFEVASIVRTCGSLPRETLVVQPVVNNLLLNNARVGKMDIGCLNIVLHALGKLAVDTEISRPVVDKLFQQLARSESLISGSDLSVLPHLLHSISRVAISGEHVKISSKISRMILRNPKAFKPVSLAVGLEGIRILRSRFPEDADVRVIARAMEETLPTLIEQYLLLTPVEEREALLTSKYAVYSPWFADSIRRSLEGASSAPVVEIPSSSVKSSTITTEAEYSYMFRAALSKKYLDDQERAAMVELMKKFDACTEQVGVKTIARALQVCVRHGLNEFVPNHVNSVLERFRDISTEDLPGILSLLLKAKIHDLGEHKDIVEAKIAVELGTVKSLSTRNTIIANAKRLGIDDPEDLLDVWEKTLATDRIAKLGKNSS